MQASWIQKVLPMPSGSALRLNNAKNTTLKVQEGLVWITEEGVDEDHFLHTGEHYAVRGDGLVIIGAESDARVGVTDYAERQAPISPLVELFLKITGNAQSKRSW
jgi:Protein of unknown function (DUF2917)